jgi:hypothetical protein
MPTRGLAALGLAGLAAVLVSVAVLGVGPFGGADSTPSPREGTASPGQAASAGPSGSLEGPSSNPTVALGPDGLPVAIGGERVYRLTDGSEWTKLDGGFLLGGYPWGYFPPCIGPDPAVPTAPPAVADLVGDIGCNYGVFLQPFPWEYSVDGQFTGLKQFKLAPKSVGLVGPTDGPGMVARVHVHDAAASGCPLDERAACDVAIVLDEVVWSTTGS